MHVVVSSFLAQALEVMSLCGTQALDVLTPHPIW